MMLRYFKLVFISLFFVTEFGMAAQPSIQSIKSFSTRTSAELDVLARMQGDYLTLTKEILGSKKTGRFANLLLDPKFQTVVVYSVFFLVIRFSNGSVNGFIDEIKKIPQCFDKNGPKYAEINNVFGGMIRSSGLRYAMPAKFLTGLILTFLADYASAPRFVSLDTLDKFKENLMDVLSACEHGYDAKSVAGISPKFFHDILSLLEQDYLLVYDKVINETCAFNASIIYIIFKSFMFAVYFYFIKSGYFEVSWILGFAVLFALHKFILPSKNNFKKSDKLGEIYKLIKDTRASLFNPIIKPDDTVIATDEKACAISTPEVIVPAVAEPVVFVHDAQKSEPMPA